MLVLYAFSGTGAALLVFWATNAWNNRNEKRRKATRKKELLKIIYEEISTNAHKLAQMISDPHFRPYWMCSTQSFDSSANELVALLTEESSILNDLFGRYRCYHMLNRQLDLLHFRDEGLKASIYLDSTLPLAESEFPRTDRLRGTLARLLCVAIADIKIEMPYDPDDFTCNYDDVNRLYEQAWADVETYWSILAAVGKAIYTSFETQLKCSKGLLSLALNDDETEGHMSPLFFDTRHFRNIDDGTYCFKIQILLGRRETEKVITIPLVMWIKNSEIQIRVRNGEYKFSIPTEGEHDFTKVAKLLIAILVKMIKENLKNIVPK